MQLILKVQLDGQIIDFFFFFNRVLEILLQKVENTKIVSIRAPVIISPTYNYNPFLY